MKYSSGCAIILGPYKFLKVLCLLKVSTPRYIGFDGTNIILNYLRLLRGHVTKFLFRDIQSVLASGTSKHVLAPNDEISGTVCMYVRTTNKMKVICEEKK